MPNERKLNWVYNPQQNQSSPYATTLPDAHEILFRQWVANNNIPFDPRPQADYDMRGFFQGALSGDPVAQTAINQSDGLIHFPDKWKTPYHETFSDQSIYASPGATPHWDDNKYVSPSGDVMKIELPQSQPQGLWHGGVAGGNTMADDSKQPLDFGDYMLAHNGDDHFVVEHPDGSQLTIAKPGLSDGQHDAISSLPPTASSHDSVSNAINVDPNKYGLASIPVLGDLYRDLTNPKHQLQRQLSLMGSDNPERAAVQSKLAALDTPAAASESASAPNTNGAPTAGGDTLAADPGISAPKPQPTPASNVPNPIAGITQGFNTQMGGIRKQANAEGAQGREMANVYADQAAKLKQVDDETNALVARKSAEGQTLKQDVINGKVDPHKWWGNLDTGNRVLAAISLALGGIGGGLTGKGGNVALDIINKTIDDDINAQKSNLESKKWLLEDNHQSLRDLRQSQLEKKANALAVAEAQVHRIAAKYQDPLSQGKAQQLIGGLQQSYAVTMAQMGQQVALTRARQALASGSGNINPEMLDKDTRERAVRLPNGNYALAPTKEDATTVKNSLTSLDAIGKHIKNMEDFGKKNGKTAGVSLPLIGETGSDAYHEGRNEQRSLILELNKLHDLNRLNDNEFHTFSAMVPDPGAWNTGKAQAQLNTLKKLIENKRQAEYSNHLEGAAAAGPYVPSSVSKGYVKR